METNVPLDQLAMFCDETYALRGYVAISDIRRKFGVSQNEAKELMTRMANEAGWDNALLPISKKDAPQ